MWDDYAWGPIGDREGRIDMMHGLWLTSAKTDVTGLIPAQAGFPSSSW